MPDEDRTLKWLFRFGLENLMTSREHTLYNIFKTMEILKTVFLICCFFPFLDVTTAAPESHQGTGSDVTGVG